MQILKASLKLQDYNPKRDFVAFGGDAVDIPRVQDRHAAAREQRRLEVHCPPPRSRRVGSALDRARLRRRRLAEGQGAASATASPRSPSAAARRSRVKGQPFVFRREFNVPAELLQQKGVVFRLSVASDDSATVYLNGTLVDQDPEPDHEFAYWNREVDLKPQQLRPGRNVVAALVKNGPSSSDLYLDMEISAQVPLPKKVAAQGSGAAGGESRPKTPPLPVGEAAAGAGHRQGEADA